MKKNMGSTDKVIRLLIVIIFFLLYFTGTVSGALGGVLVALGGVFVITSILGTCPLYIPFGISTCKKK
jgi:drug/metabolite transporter superfamily protein YnfA